MATLIQRKVSILYFARVLTISIVVFGNIFSWRWSMPPRKHRFFLLAKNTALNRPLGEMTLRTPVCHNCSSSSISVCWTWAPIPTAWKSRPTLSQVVCNPLNLRSNSSMSTGTAEDSKSRIASVMNVLMETFLHLSSWSLGRTQRELLIQEVCIVGSKQVGRNGI